MTYIVVIAIFKAVDDSFAIKWNHGLIPQPFKSVVNSVKVLIIYLSFLLFVAVIKMALQSYTYMT